MSIDNLAQRITPAQEALRSFLATLLGTDAPLRIDEPAMADVNAANDRSRQHIVLTGGASDHDRWAVVLDPPWLPLLSKSMLGEPIEVGEPGADDLLKELAAQAYGAVRTQLSASGVHLSDAEITLMGAGDELDGQLFSPGLVDIPFQMIVEDETLHGFALIPPIDEHPGSIDPQTSAKEEEDEQEDGSDVETLGDLAPGLAETSEARSGGSTHDRPGRRPVQVQPAAFPDLGAESIGGDGSDAGFQLLAEVELEVTVELGRRSIPLADVLRLTTGSVIELEKLVGEPLEVYANGRLIAEGEAVVMDEQFGIRITNLSNGRAKGRAFV
jgi:flagellar motor switch protein FliN/FliY